LLSALHILQRRRVHWLVGLTLAAATAILPWVSSPALASPLQEKQAELAASQAHLDGLQADIDRLTETWAGTEEDVRATEAAIKQAEADETAAKLELDRKKIVLAERLAHYYKERHGSFPLAVKVFLGSDSLTDVLNQLPLLFDIVHQDRDLLDQVAALTAGLAIQQEELGRQRDSLRAKLSALAITKAEINRLIGAAADEQARLQQEVDVLAHADRLAREAEAARNEHRGHVSSRTLARARGFVFPVDGPHSFIDDWGFPRPDDRIHKGTDVMARWGASVVAASSGRISRVAYRMPLGGTVIWLDGDNGVSYYYAHLAKVASDIHAGTRVVAGYPIGKVGDTGNARGGDPHLHFGMYPGGGAPVDPYLILRISD
jgi:murein DD-endopeptidase MepM/ murein hydrolase activator NlpD